MNGEDHFHLDEYGHIESELPEDDGYEYSGHAGVVFSDRSGFGGPDGFDVTVSLPDGTSHSFAGEDNRAFILALGVVTGVDFDALPIFDWSANDRAMAGYRSVCLAPGMEGAKKNCSESALAVEFKLYDFDGWNELMEDLDKGVIANGDAWAKLSSMLQPLLVSLCNELGLQYICRIPPIYHSLGVLKKDPQSEWDLSESSLPLDWESDTWLLTRVWIL